MKHTTQKGTIAQLAIIMIVSLVSITQGIYAASSSNCHKVRKTQGKYRYRTARMLLQTVLLPEVT
ncbi:MAG: hypothetical protein BROFUL_00505 [Candidatus Brocadia fulgida]|uniref:Uncharacterized protein n=1 Tax=Candidatus Brocadia fulgida TaxID=380242 RepID=A0A0M2UY24_9BACT|nr:MAG: hypothetical protein BROFUL_00505 [Candidatus Brocadia fulgida]